MKLSICQLPDDLTLDHAAWTDLLAHLDREKPDLAVLNEMPFGAWVAREPLFDAKLASACVQSHELAVSALKGMSTAVLSSRPVMGPQKLSNEAFLVADGACRPIHHKHLFPQDTGFYEDSWFSPTLPGFDVIEYRDLRIGVLLCTELMFNEWARHYRRQGANVIIAPRASGAATTRYWHIAAAMAAVVSGCYVVSSNRVSTGAGSVPNFGGCGFAYSPNAELLVETSQSRPFASVEIDLARVAEAQKRYPCCVRELGGPASA